MAVIKASRYSFPETVSRISDAITQAGNTIFATIDQSAAASTVQMTLRPTSLIVFGNPKGGTPIMDAFPVFALELPLKILVWQDDGKVLVAYAPATQNAARYSVTGMDERLSAMDKAMEKFTASVC